MINQVFDVLVAIICTGIGVYIWKLETKNSELKKALTLSELKNDKEEIKKQIDDTPLDQLVSDSNKELSEQLKKD